MIEAKVTEQQEVQSNPTPAVITVSGIISDLENGIDRDGIAEKYSLTKTEVKTMFMHPALKGKRVKKNRVKELRFQLVDDVTPQTVPNQMDLQDAIETEVAETTQPSQPHYEFETFLNDGNS